ncbi:TauD/TfdA family dioxygenase, partial [Bacillus pseudomycoides]
NDNRIVRHVSPSISAVSDISSHGSKIAFGMHVDNPDLPLSTEQLNDLSGCPEYLALHSLRYNPSVPTKVMLLDDVLKHLSSEVIEELQKPQFEIKRPDSFVGMNVTGDYLPVLSRCESLGFISRYDKQNVIGKNEKATQALIAFQNVIENSDDINEFILEPGDYVIFRNQKTLHARDGFVPEFNGIDRWMIRMFGLNNLNRGIPVKNNVPYILEA